MTEAQQVVQSDANSLTTGRAEEKLEGQKRSREEQFGRIIRNKAISQLQAHSKLMSTIVDRTLYT